MNGIVSLSSALLLYVCKSFRSDQPHFLKRSYQVFFLNWEMFSRAQLPTISQINNMLTLYGTSLQFTGQLLYEDEHKTDQTIKVRADQLLSTYILILKMRICIFYISKHCRIIILERQTTLPTI